MEKITFDDFDKLNLKTFGENLFQIMKNETTSPLTEGAYTISLNAEFGNGKTTFLKMFKNFIEKKNENYDVLFINAWESDFSKEPVIAILSELINWMEKNKINNNNEKNKLLGVLGNIGNQIFKNKTGIDIKEIKESCDESIGENLLKDFNQRKEAINEVKEIIPKYIKEKKLLIIVDELDRTRPDYAISFLEDMKHFFDTKEVVFLFAVNRGQIEETARCLYGQKMDFDGYYRKFFKQEIDLPDPYEEARKFISDLVKEKKQEIEIKHIEIFSYMSCKMFQLTLREIELFLEIFKRLMPLPESGEINYNKYYPFFVCLFIKKRETFNKVLNANFNAYDLPGFLKDENIINLLFNKDIYRKPRRNISNESIKEIPLFLKMITCSLITDPNHHLGAIFDEVKKLFPEEILEFLENPNNIRPIVNYYDYNESRKIISILSHDGKSMAMTICEHIKDLRFNHE